LQQQSAGSGRARPHVVGGGGSIQTSARSSIDSTSRVTSPTPSSLNGAGKNTGEVDFVYLKNVLLQFLETREKKHQMQLVPVLGMLLQMDKADQQKFASAIGAR
jgi:hypothetical protein